jgi:DNA-binding response OmpR family regulator
MPRNGSGKPILIVDDDPDVRFVLRSFLEGKGYETITAEDGSRILELIETKHPALIILDVMMPDKGGLEVCREIRARGLRTPVLILSSKNVQTDPEGVAQAGADAYMAKPFDLNEVEKAARALLARRPGTR